MDEYRTLLLKLDSLAVFRNLLEHPALSALRRLLRSLSEEPGAAAPAYAALSAEIYREGGDLTDLILRLMRSDDNFYVRLLAAGRRPTEEMTAWLPHEFAALGQAASLRSEDLIRAIGTEIPLPGWKSRKADIAREMADYLREVDRKGYGIFSLYHAFRVGEDGGLIPVEHPDSQTLEELWGYRLEREKVLQNTESLMAGRSANNVLLYGDAGTGKSSTVKAMLNRFASDGLRLIQIDRDKLARLPLVLDTIAEHPLKFILFIDDLSFDGDGPGFTALKAMLEGDIGARPRNTVIYATSNRRHFVRENFSDREGSEVHLTDTLEETASLAARFGLVVTFKRPDKDLYLKIAERYAKAAGLERPREELFRQAEAYAIRNGGRSPRTARQFVEYTVSLGHPS